MGKKSLKLSYYCFDPNQTFTTVNMEWALLSEEKPWIFVMLSFGGTGWQDRQPNRISEQEIKDHD